MKKGGKKKWGLTVRKLTRTQYGNWRETPDERKADGISSQQILGLFSCLNPLIWSEECAVCTLCSLFFRHVLAVHLISWFQMHVHGQSWAAEVCAGGLGLHAQDQRWPAQGTSACLPGQAQSHRAQVCCEGPCPGSLNNPSFAFHGKWEISQVTQGRAQGSCRSCRHSMVEEEDPFPQQKISSFQGT